MNTQITDPWLFNSSEIYNQSPSRVDGITWVQEKELRSLGCRFIHELVSKMRRTGSQAASEAVTESAACIFFHRFFTYESFKKHHRWIIAATCVFLAFKVEEHPRHIDSVIKAYCEMRSNKTEEEFKKSRDHILTAERIVLNVLCFDLRLDHPISPCVAKFRGDLKSFIPQAREVRIEFVNKALNFLRDSAGTILCIIYPAQKIAMGAVFLAILQSNCLPSDPLNRDSDKNIANSITTVAQTWYELLKNDITTDELMDVCTQMIEVYEDWSDRDRRKSSTKQGLSAPDVSSMRRGIGALSASQLIGKISSNSHSNNGNSNNNNFIFSVVNPTSQTNDREEVNLDDPYPYDEPSHHHHHQRSITTTSSSSSTTTTTTTTTPIIKSILKTNKSQSYSDTTKPIMTVIAAPPTPDFQPPSTPEFHPPSTPQFYPPASPQMVEPSLKNNKRPPPTPDFQPPPTPEFHPPSTPEFLPPSTPESHMMPPPSSSSSKRQRF